MGYRQGYISFMLPRVRGSRFGSGLNVQYFDSPIFRRSQTGAGVSYRILNNLSVGVHGSLLHFSYNSDNFVGFDMNDPVFSDGFTNYSLNTAAGVYYRPLPMVELAAGARNINEPTLSLGSDNMSEPRQLFAGVSYRHGLLKGTFELVHGRYGMESHLHAELFSTRGFYTRTGTNLNFDSAYLEAQAHVGGGYSVNYQFDLPINEFAGNSSGSHMFSIVYEFNRIPSVPNKLPAPVTYPNLDRLMPDIRFAGDIFLSSQTDHVINYQKEIIRRIDENSVNLDELSSLSEYDLGKIGEDPRKDQAPYSAKALAPTVPIPETVEMPTSISPQYRQAINYIVSQLEQDKSGTLKIKSNPGSEIRAAGVRNELRNRTGEAITVEQISFSSESDSLRFENPADMSMVRNEEIATMEPEVARIHAINTHAASLRSWSLQISDENDRVIHTISGGSTLPEIIEWDWRLTSGDFVPPGVYTYQLNWTSANGNSYQSNRRGLYVQKILRKITIDITKDLNQILSDPDSIEIILKNN